MIQRPVSYKNSQDCRQQLADIEAIDYFFAQKACKLLSISEQGLLFHLFLALHWSLRQGNSCLQLSRIADQLLWQESEDVEMEPHHQSPTPESVAQGYLFADLPTLIDCLSQYPLGEDDDHICVFEGQNLYIRRYWAFEKEVAAWLSQRISTPLLEHKQLQQGQAIILRLFAHGKENPAQKIAVSNAIGKKFLIVSGGPGTGKTYTAARILITLLATQETAHQRPAKILMAAPTGKAAQRLQESIALAMEQLSESIEPQQMQAITQTQATTLHRLLGLHHFSVQPKYHADHPLPCDLLLIDEASMIDLPMMVKILRALPDQAKLILLGDANQLPAVETGNILDDICIQPHPGFSVDNARQIEQISGISVRQSTQEPCDYLNYLDTSFRFAGNIAKLAQMVINKQADESWQLLQNQTTSDQGSLQHNNAISLNHSSNFQSWLTHRVEQFIRPIQEAENLAQAFQQFKQFRLLCPVRAGHRGVVQLNETITRLLGHGHSTYYKACPIMVIENNYASGLFNGDNGLIWPDASGKLYAWFEEQNGQYKQVSLARLPAWEKIYAMTIHKTQGSEFDHIAIVLPEKMHRLLNPRLLYTAITRAKTQLDIFTEEAIWKQAVNNPLFRYSGLREKLNLNTNALQ